MHAKVMQLQLLVWNGNVMMLVFVKRIQCVLAIRDISTIKQLKFVVVGSSISMHSLRGDSS